MSKAKGGRPSKLNETTVGLLEKVFVGGSTVGDACAYVGISESTFYKWMKTGREISDGHKRDEKHAHIPYLLAERDVFVEFFQRIKKARSIMRIEAIAIIRIAAQDGNWQAAAWLLERSAPEHWGRKVLTQNSTVDITSDGEAIRSTKIDDLTEFFQALGQIERQQQQSD